jgi:hypothetical protein
MRNLIVRIAAVLLIIFGGTGVINSIFDTDYAFRMYGNTISIDLDTPSSWGLFLAGLILLGGSIFMAMRAKKK